MDYPEGNRPPSGLTGDGSFDFEPGTGGADLRGVEQKQERASRRFETFLWTRALTSTLRAQTVPKEPMRLAFGERAAARTGRKATNHAPTRAETWKNGKFSERGEVTVVTPPPPGGCGSRVAAGMGERARTRDDIR